MPPSPFGKINPPKQSIHTTEVASVCRVGLAKITDKYLQERCWNSMFPNSSDTVCDELPLLTVTSLYDSFDLDVTRALILHPNPFKMTPFCIFHKKKKSSGCVCAKRCSGEVEIKQSATFNEACAAGLITYFLGNALELKTVMIGV